MDFALTANQESIRDAVAKICARFDDGYWLKKDKDGGFPADFHKALADAGWLGICIPEAYGGSGLGIVEAAIMMRTIAESGGGMFRGAHECVWAQSRCRIRQQGAVQADAAADRSGDREVMLCRHRAEYRA
jgi:alkylation response protein AidB-like acyl-CoA dehydrogenase